MKLEDRIEAFVKLGEEISALKSEEVSLISKQAQHQNPWFTEDSVRSAIRGIIKFLDKDAILQWVSNHPLEVVNPKIVGIAMAGNIPLVGFHDYLSTLISGHKAVIKLSSQDTQLLQEVTRRLVKIEPGFEEAISFVDRLSGYHAAMATGSDNTARYFEYYFREVPHIIRKNKSSCAVIQGTETSEELRALGKDVFTYFGLGCRNVSKLFVPEEYDFQLLMQTWEEYGEIINHHKYANNYNYQRAIHLVNRIPFYDNGIIILPENEKLVSPTATLYYERYKDREDLVNRIEKTQNKIQSIVSAKGWFSNSIAFGEAQFPEVFEYADGIDTLKFLSEI